MTAPRPTHGDDAAPREVLGEVWPLLDELPPARASAALAATTIDMAAVDAGDASPARGGIGFAARLAAALAVVAALGAGVVAGRATAPDADRAVLEQLPLVRHVDLLREAGSVRFLEEVAGRGGPPLRMLLRGGPEAARKDTAAFEAELDSLRALAASRSDAADRRAYVAGLALEDRVELERAARTWQSLSNAERRALATVASALVDPARPELRAAALDWHRWLATRRPEDRDELIVAGTDKRLAWIDWYATRLDPRNGPTFPSRPPRDWERDRRGRADGPPPPAVSGAPAPPAGTRAPPR